jgi:hypothetical protein
MISVAFCQDEIHILTQMHSVFKAQSIPAPASDAHRGGRFFFPSAKATILPQR